MSKYLTETSQLRTFLQRRGVSYNAATKKWRCPCHDDAHESATLYENPDGNHILHCNVNGGNFNIFKVCELLDNLHEFKEQLKAVRDTLGIADIKPKKKPVALSPDEAKKVYAREKIEKIAADKKYGEIKGSWKYTDARGDVLALDVRFEKPGEKKIILTFWYDGKSLHWKDAPVLIYNLQEVKNGKPILISEGAKCAEASRALVEFTPISWSGGSAKSAMADWSILVNADVFIFPDDDESGIKAARTIRERIHQAKIIRPVPAARTIKPKGADIVEALQIMTPDELTAYILDPQNHLNDCDINPPELTGTPPLPPPDGSFSEPFKILGIGDDSRAAFITSEGRLMKWSLDSMSKNKLIVLTGRGHWQETYPSKGGADYDSAIDDVIRECQRLDFNDSHVRGRGAWRDGDKVSYHDGIETVGEWDDKIIYLRLPRHNIGITDAPAEADLCRKVKDEVFKMSFETKTDAVRVLGWAALAPFAGALKYRPCILLTGPSGSGKSTIQELIIKKLTECIWCDTKETSTAGIRSRIGKDSACVFFEEGDRTTDKMKMNVDDIMAFVRSNYTSNSPDAFKGTKEGGWVNYKMNSMFGIASISPTIENIADENRIFRINMVPPENNSDWREIEKTLIKLLSDTNCRAIRALTWEKFQAIMTLTERVIDMIRALTCRDYRSSYADAMLASAFMVTWSGVDDPTDEQIMDMLTKYYSYQPAEEHRNEADEVVERLMDEQIEILYDKEREKITIAECLEKVYKSGYPTDDGLESPRILTYRECLARYGIRLVDECNVAIANNHHQIMKITGMGKGYSKLLKRHSGCIDKNRVVYFYASKNKKCTIIRGLIKQKWDDKTETEKVEALFE